MMGCLSVGAQCKQTNILSGEKRWWGAIASIAWAHLGFCGLALWQSSIIPTLYLSANGGRVKMIMHLHPRFLWQLLFASKRMMQLEEASEQGEAACCISSINASGLNLLLAAPRRGQRPFIEKTCCRVDVGREISVWNSSETQDLDTLPINGVGKSGPLKWACPASKVSGTCVWTSTVRQIPQFQWRWRDKQILRSSSSVMQDWTSVARWLKTIWTSGWLSFQWHTNKLLTYVASTSCRFPPPSAWALIEQRFLKMQENHWLKRFASEIKMEQPRQSAF